jgi:hypothetical protein
MKKRIEKLKKYFDGIGAGCIEIAIAQDVKEKLPVFMNQAYIPYRTRIFGKNYLLFMVVGGLHLTPSAAEKQYKLAGNSLGEEIVFVFERLQSYDRKRYSERGIPFIVPGMQTFLPPAFIDLRERGCGRIAPITTELTKLSAPSQVVLLYYLQNKNTKGWTLNKWAEVLKYSNSTMTRVRREMETADLCHVEGQGRTVIFSFPENKRKLWKNSMPFMKSPVRSRTHVFMSKFPKNKLLESGFSALSRMSMLSEGQNQIYAMSASTYQSAIEKGLLRKAPVSADKSVIIERWRYAPGLLSDNCVSVDRLSLYLSLRNDPDERVQNAINGLLEQISW